MTEPQDRVVYAASLDTIRRVAWMCDRSGSRAIYQLAIKDGIDVPDGWEIEVAGDQLRMLRPGSKADRPWGFE